MHRTNPIALAIRKHTQPSTIETVIKNLEVHGTAIADFRKKVDSDLTEQKTGIAALAGRLDKIEARGNRVGESDDAGPAEILKAITSSQGFELLKGGQKSTGRIVLPGSYANIRKALTSIEAGGSPNTGYHVPRQRASVIGEDPRRRLTLLDVLPHLPVTSNLLEFQQLEGYSSGAADQGGEGLAKAQTNVPLSLQAARVATIAHYVKASRQVLEDAPLLQSYLNGLLTYGVSAKLEALIVAGTLGSNIEGLVALATAFAPSATTPADRISEAQATLESAGWNPGLVVLNSVDWHRIRTERATGGDNQYVAGGWNQPSAPNVWGLPIVTTPSLASGTALVLDPGVVAILDRSQVNVMIGYENDDFTRNLVTILAEGRFGFAVFSNGGVFKVPLAF